MYVNNDMYIYIYIRTIIQIINAKLLKSNNRFEKVVRQVLLILILFPNINTN